MNSRRFVAVAALDCNGCLLQSAVTMTDDIDKLRQIGDDISAKVAALRAARRQSQRPPKRQGGWHRGELDRPYQAPLSADAFLRLGGMSRIEARAAAEAAKRAVHREREYWLPTLKRWLDADPDDTVRWFLERELRQLRRRLGRKPSAATVRRQTRERVRRHRARKLAR
jgi:hypothetical protein